MMRVGFVGLGAMGMHMARNLHRAGLLAAVWNRTAEKARTLAAELNVQAPATIEALGSSVDAVVTCVSADKDVLEVVKELAKSLPSAAESRRNPASPGR
jgi:3-hydroxyisobutyrate dehydrogenase